MVRHRQPGASIVFVAQERNREHTADLGEFLPVPLDPKALVDVVGRLVVEPAELASLCGAALHGPR